MIQQNKKKKKKKKNSQHITVDLKIVKHPEHLFASESLASLKKDDKTVSNGKATATSIQNWQKIQEAKEKKTITIGKQVKKLKRFFVCLDPTHNTKFQKRKVSKTVANSI